MTNLVWSIALAATGIVGLWLAGSGRWQGWAFGVIAQLAWIVFALVTGQVGFIISALAYGFVYGRNLVRWRKKKRRMEDLVERGRSIFPTHPVGPPTGPPREPNPAFVRKVLREP